MQSIRLYQLYDHTAMTVVGVIIAATRPESAIRNFTEILSMPETMPGKYPLEYSLIELGGQNLDTGQIESIEPKTIFTGRIWLRMKDKPATDATPTG